MPVRPSVQQWYGTLMHSVLERAGRLRHAGDSLDGDRLAALWQRAWEDSHGPKGTAAELRAYGEQTLRAYAETPAWTQARIAAVEQPFALRVDEGEVRGRFDRIDMPRDGPPIVIDYKTGPPVAEQTAARDLQLRAYAVALSRQEGVEEVAVELHHLQTAEVVRIELDAAALKRAGGQLGATCGELASAWRERSFPPSPSAWRCRRCDYRTVCDEGREAAASG
jgi:RecB family exonuclease